MSIGLIVLIGFLACVLIAGLPLALIDRAPIGWQDRNGFHVGDPPAHVTEEELERWN